jgi:flagella basal body P-ring formation protein FlgA
MAPRSLLLLVGFCAWAAAIFAAPAPDAAPTDPWLAALTPMLAEHYQLNGDLVLTWARPRPVNAPADATLVIANFPSELAPQLLVSVRATDAKGKTTEHTLVLHVELWRDGWTSREPADLGAALDPSRLDLRRYDAMRERDALASDTASAADLNFSRNVPAGRLLVWRDFVRRPLVRRGQPVEVSATDGVLTVVLHGVALQDAARGESVRVRNPDTKKEFTALVTAEARAAVRF